MVWMEDNIRYGWLDIDGNRHIDEMKSFRRLYRTMSIEEILREKIGTFKDNKCYHIEHPAYKNKGIWEYGLEEEALKVITDHYIQLRGDKENPVN